MTNSHSPSIIIIIVIKMKEKIKKYWKDAIIVAFGIIIIILVILLIINYHRRTSGSDTNYDEIVSLVENKDSFLIYYYNSKSSNKNNRKIKKYLDKEGIKYYLYDDVNVDKKEYTQFLSLIDVDKKIFGVPALIYYKNGEMYGNLINIDGIPVVEKFINDYDLYMVK